MELYEINERIKLAIEDIESKVELDNGDVIDTDTGEVIDVDLYYDTMRVAIEKLKMYKREKEVACLCMVKNKKAFIKAMEDEIERLSNKIEKEKATVEVLTDVLADSLDGEKLEIAQGTVRYMKSTRVYIDVPLSKIPEEFIKTTVKQELDKTKVKSFIKGGGTIEGCGLQERNNIIIK